MGLKIKNNELYLNDEFVGGFEIREKGDDFLKLNYWEDDFNLPEVFYELRNKDLIDNLKIESKDFDILRKDGKTLISMFSFFDFSDWEFGLSPKRFCKELEKAFNSYELYTVEITDALDIKMAIILEEDETIYTGIEFLKKEYQSFIDNVLVKNQVFKSINFSPEHLSTGTSILQYFSKILQEKYPNENVSVSIKQEGLKVSMTVETPEGKKEEIEEYLNKFGMVITNQISPTEFTSNPIQVLELETKLAQAEQEIGFQKKLLALQDKTYDENLVSLKDEVKYLREELSVLRVSSDGNIHLLLTSLQLKDKMIKKLTKAVKNQDTQKTRELLVELKTKDNKGYISLKEHFDNALVGTIVNAPSWVQFLITHIK